MGRAETNGNPKNVSIEGERWICEVSVTYWLHHEVDNLLQPIPGTMIQFCKMFIASLAFVKFFLLHFLSVCPLSLSFWVLGEASALGKTQQNPSALYGSCGFFPLAAVPTEVDQKRTGFLQNRLL